MLFLRREQLLNREKSSSLDTGLSRMSSRSLKRSNTIGSPGRNHSRYVQKLNMGEARDDVHVCIMCLRAIMNHQVNMSSFAIKPVFRVSYQVQHKLPQPQKILIVRGLKFWI